MIINLFSLVILLLILCSSSFLVSASDSGGGNEYNYKKGDSKGPENWGNLKPEWKLCGNGKLQSPIDILNKRVQELPQLGKLEKDYKLGPAFLKNRFNDVMLQWKGYAGKLNLNGTYYKLIQCHWHTPSEHTLNGSKFDMEQHCVHQNSKDEIAVIGIWYKIGRPDPLLSKLLNHIKSIRDKEIDVGIINPADIFKFGGTKYYRHIGSLTSPPCTEDVIWTVLKKVKTVSVEQLKALKAVNHGFEENARPTQDLDGRKVWFYNPRKEKKST
uniref:Alpha-carbonic anhydrase domain-containing protein n=1 Tax=Medicago truncatula TaxID=3880 RepID=I3T498_MEDTR|nr:unknown [Medicago truncatula]